MKRLLSILFWSVLSAAFIGPGTITVAASAGERYGATLLWALLFSTVACIVLQEASARVTIVSGRSLGTALRERFDPTPFRWPVLILVLLAVVAGCAAYQAGNILGAVAGASLTVDLPPWSVSLSVSGVAFVLLWKGTVRFVCLALGCVVGVMGAVFLFAAADLLWGGGGSVPTTSSLVEGALVPRLPMDSLPLVLGLIGTTVVPYNLFLGSGAARGRKLKDARFGIVVAVLLGGVISMGVLIVGTSLQSGFSYEALAVSLGERLGGSGRVLFSVGLFAAGLSSAITAPLAAGLTTVGLFGGVQEGKKREETTAYRIGWIVVLGTGLLFGLLGVKPVPAIIAAQVFNGVLLPFVAIVLLVLVNDARLMGEERKNGRVNNLLLSIVVLTTLALGARNIYLAL